MRSESEDHNDSWWPPAARHHPLVSDWWLKLDLLLKQQRGTRPAEGVRWVGQHPSETMAVSGGRRSRCRTTEAPAPCQRRCLCVRLTSGGKCWSILWSSNTSVVTIGKGKCQSWVLLIERSKNVNYIDFYRVYSAVWRNTWKRKVKEG